MSFLSILPQSQTERDNYKLLTGSIIPRPVAFVTTLSETGILNGAPFSYFNIVSADPPLISVAVQRSAGQMKDTARNIAGRKEFVVHIVDEVNVDQVNQTAANLPPEESEVEQAGMKPEPSLKIAVPGVREAKVRMECVLEQALELGGNGEPSCDLIIGRVVCFHIDESIYQKGRIDPRGLNAVSRLAGSDYAKIGESFSIERPQ